MRPVEIGADEKSEQSAGDGDKDDKQVGAIEHQGLSCAGTSAERTTDWVSTVGST